MALKDWFEQQEPGDSVKVTTLRDESIYHYNVTLAPPE